VVIVLPNGPEMATAFFTLAQAATTAPHNPAYREDEYEFYLDDIKAMTLLLAEGDDGPAASAASKLGIPVMRLSVLDNAAAGYFTLSSDLNGAAQALSNTRSRS
jgi:acyl-CoA synthetase (AMP-forming)/AMP-acid ligase II